MLDAEDLAFMRETQAETRPTPAELKRRVQGTSASGGRVDTFQDGVPINVRLDGQEKNVPDQVTAVVGAGKAVKIVMDLVEVRSGDVVVVSPTEEYTVVTDGDPDQWATAQIVWSRRTKEAKRALP